MIQTLKIKKNFDSIKKKSFKNKISATQNFTKSSQNKKIAKTVKHLRPINYLLRNKKKKKEYLFLKLIQKINQPIQIRSAVKENFLKFPDKTFFTRNFPNFKIKLNVKTKKIKTVLIKSVKILPKYLFSRQKHLYLLRRENKSKLLPSFYEP